MMKEENRPICSEDEEEIKVKVALDVETHNNDAPATSTCLNTLHVIPEETEPLEADLLPLPPEEDFDEGDSNDVTADYELPSLPEVTSCAEEQHSSFNINTAISVKRSSEVFKEKLECFDQNERCKPTETDLSTTNTSTNDEQGSPPATNTCPDDVEKSVELGTVSTVVRSKNTFKSMLQDDQKKSDNVVQDGQSVEHQYSIDFEDGFC